MLRQCRVAIRTAHFREAARDELYKNRSSRKNRFSVRERVFGENPILLKIVSGNRFSGKTNFYAIAAREESKLRALALLQQRLSQVVDHDDEKEERQVDTQVAC